MPDRTPPKTPETYDDIVRRTVPLPDSSFRPSRDEVRQAHEPPPEPVDVTGDLGELRALLAADRIDLDDVAFERDGEALVVRGSVATGRDRDAILAAARKVDGFDDVRDQLRVRL